MILSCGETASGFAAFLLMEMIAVTECNDGGGELTG